MRVTMRFEGVDAILKCLDRFPREFARAKRPAMAKLGDALVPDLRGRILQQKFDVAPNAAAWREYKQRAAAAADRRRARRPPPSPGQAWPGLGAPPAAPKAPAPPAGPSQEWPGLGGPRAKAPRRPASRGSRANRLARYVDPLTWTGGYAAAWRARLDAQGALVLAPKGQHPVTRVSYQDIAKWLEGGTKVVPARPHLVPFGEEVRRTRLLPVGQAIVRATLAAAQRR